MALEPEARADWVLTLPPGPKCSIGYSDNEAVNQDGSMSRRKDNEDRHYTCHFQDRIQLYMVLDGHDGTNAVEFARTEIPRLLLEQKILEAGAVLEALKETILKTEQNFFTRIDCHITRMISLQIEIEQSDPDIDSAAAYRLFPTQIAEIGQLGELIKGGTTVVAALIHENKLYVANVGDSRALLCSQNSDGSVTKVEQISVDHNTNNEEELRRLAGCGLDPKKLQQCGRLGMQQNTRSIGDYSIKGGYKNVDVLSHATSQPGVAEPYLHGPVDLSAFHGFLILMSDGFYDAYQAWTRRPDRINEDIANLVASELTDILNFDTIAQNIVEKVKSMYCETCKRYQRPGRMDDITLIIRSLRPSPHAQANTTACVSGVNGVSAAYHERYMPKGYQTQSLFAGERHRAHSSNSHLAFGEEQLSIPPHSRHASNPIPSYESKSHRIDYQPPFSKTSEYTNRPQRLRDRSDREILSTHSAPTSPTYPSKPHPRVSTWSSSLSPTTGCPGEDKNGKQVCEEPTELPLTPASLFGKNSAPRVTSPNIPPRLIVSPSEKNTITLADIPAKTEEGEEEEEEFLMYGWTTGSVNTPDGPHVKLVRKPTHQQQLVISTEEK